MFLATLSKYMSYRGAETTKPGGEPGFVLRLSINRASRGELFDDAGDEGLLRLGACEGVEGELAAVLCAEFEEEAGAMRVVGIDGVNEAHPWDAVEMAFVGDGGERGLEFPGGKALGNDGDAHWRADGGDECSGVDEGGQAAIAERVASDLLILEGERRRSGCGSVVRARGVRRCRMGGCCGLRGGCGSGVELRTGGGGFGGGDWTGGCRFGRRDGSGLEMVGGQVLMDERLRELLHLRDGLGALDDRVPIASKDVNGVVGGVRYSDRLMQVGGGSVELRWSCGGLDLAAVDLGTVWVCIEGGGHGLHAGARVTLLLLLLVIGDVATAEGGAVW